MRIYNRKPDLK